MRMWTENQTGKDRTFVEAGKEKLRQLEGKTALVVDDDVDHAVLVKEQLESVGMLVSGIAHDGPTALEMIEALDPSIVILDIVMPDMDGIEVARRINDREPRPILFLSAYSDIEYIEKAMATNVLTYLVKPVKIEEMVPSIILTMDRFREVSALRAAVDDMRENIINREIIDKAKKLLMAENDMSENEAYSTIRKRSREENKPIVDVAHTVVARN